MDSHTVHSPVDSHKRVALHVHFVPTVVGDTDFSLVPHLLAVAITDRPLMQVSVMIKL